MSGSPRRRRRCADIGVDRGSPGLKRMAVPLAATVMLIVSVRETAPEGRTDWLPPPPSSEDIALMEEARIWLSPGPIFGTSGASVSDRSLIDAIRLHRESFELFLRAADRERIRDRVRQVPFGARILVAAERRGIDPLLVAAVVQTESSFNEQAVSSKGAVGLMQVMPSTARDFGITDVHDPGQNLDAGACYLAHLLRRFEGDLVLALAGYNAGPGSVRRFHGLPPFRETRNFTESVLRRYIEHHRAVSAAVDGRRDLDRAGAAWPATLE